MKLIGDLMTAGELKEKVLKKRYRTDVHVIGHLESCVEGQPDSWYHIHSDEQIPVNVGVSLNLRNTP